jgi:ketosteroid isomerase-like protein
MNSKNNQQDVLELAELLSRGLTGDSDVLAAILSADFTMWLNFSGQSFNRDATINYAAGLSKQLTGLRYHDIRRTRTEHGFVQQHVIDSLLPSGERSKGIDACFVVRVRDHRIHRLDEYVDSGQFPKPQA